MNAPHYCGAFVLVAPTGIELFTPVHRVSPRITRRKLASFGVVRLHRASPRRWNFGSTGILSGSYRAGRSPAPPKVLAWKNISRMLWS